MENILNNIVLLLSNGLATYVIYRFMHVFFERRVVDRKVIIWAYVLQYIIAAIGLVWITYPIVNVFIALLCYGIIAWCYEGSFWKKITVVVIGYLTGFLVEILMMFIISKESVSLMERRHFDAYITIVIQCVIWIITLLYENCMKYIHKKENMSFSITIAIVGEMVMVIAMEFLVFQQNGIGNIIRIASVLMVTFILLITIYLYASLSKVAEVQVKKQIIENEREYYHNQAVLLQSNSEELREFRHDIKNKMLVLYELLDKNEMQEANNYLQDLVEKIEQMKNYSQSGNVIVDSIINYKLSKAENEGCNIQAEIFLPNEISIENDDLVVVMGNLLDNAIEAIEKIKENKYIKISVKYDRQCLIVRVINSFDSQINMEKGKIQTRKENSEFHGIGLESVENVVAKYRGNIKIEYKKEIFSVGVVLYPKE